MSYSKEEQEIINKFHKLIKKHGWKPMESKDGGAWFGGKSHNMLANYIPQKEVEHFEDIDFLVVGWADDKESGDE